MTFCLHTENFKQAVLDSNRNILVIKDEILIGELAIKHFSIFLMNDTIIPKFVAVIFEL